MHLAFSSPWSISLVPNVLCSSSHVCQGGQVFEQSIFLFAIVFIELQFIQLFIHYHYYYHSYYIVSLILLSRKSSFKSLGAFLLVAVGCTRTVGFDNSSLSRSLSLSFSLPLSIPLRLSLSPPSPSPSLSVSPPLRLSPLLSLSVSLFHYTIFLMSSSHYGFEFFKIHTYLAIVHFGRVQGILVPRAGRMSRGDIPDHNTIRLVTLSRLKIITLCLIHTGKLKPTSKRHLTCILKSNGQNSRFLPKYICCPTNTTRTSTRTRQSCTEQLSTSKKLL